MGVAKSLTYVERNKEDLLTRLKKIEGQIRGIQKMIEEDRYCVDILLQISATRGALQKVALSLLRSHTRGCVAQAIRQDRGDEAIEELMQVLDKFTS
ncbi:MAG: metal-sensitive transcriptional regulator [Thermoanaerobacteraceae bacterium]|nr:metal-sensitive transcriptional regulator [Thermoanaerobacteraceae bacterium]